MLLLHFEMRYNKTNRLALSVTTENCFPSVWEILPSAFGVGQYFPNFGETIFNSDLNASQYWYITTTCCELVGRVNNKLAASPFTGKLRGEVCNGF